MMEPTIERWAASGRREVVAHGAHHVVKFHPPGVPLAAVEQEAHRARIAWEAGLPVPAPGPVVVVEGWIGIVFERVDGPTMLDVGIAHPEEAAALARLFAELHARIHDCTARALPGHHDRLRAAIDGAASIPTDRRAALHERLATLPEGAALLHGDFHPGNVIMGAARPVIVDWEDAHAGHPCEDVARTASLIAGGRVPPGVAGAAPPALREAFGIAYLRHYADLRSVDQQHVMSWCCIHDAVTAAC